jgi:propionate CoA-transferase
MNQTMLPKIAGVECLNDIQDNSIVAISGFNMATTPEYLIVELHKKYIDQGHPKNIFIVSDALPAVPGRGLDQIAEKLYKEPNQGFLRGALMPFLGFAPWFQKLVSDNRIECYGWPIGIASYWFREIGSGRPGLLTKIGIDTSLDPRREGAALNEKGHKYGLCKVSILDIEGEDYLLYQAPKPNYALIRSSISDENGNLSLQDEGIRGTVLNIAQATKSRPNQGKVYSQIRWLTKSGTINPRDVDIPGPLVDCVVVAPKEYHWQSGTIEYDPRVSYRIMPSISENILESVPRPAMKIHERIIARRVVLELIKLLESKKAPVLVNLGIGIPALVSTIAAEEEVTDFIVTVLESGPWGGLTLSGNDFGLAISPFALSTIPDMFSNFEGGIIDAASLGFLQVDKEGNVNPSILPDMIFGPGGFPVIAGGAPRIYFAGSLRGGKTEFSITNNELKILNEGPIPKFIENVYRIAFSGHYAIKSGQEIHYITERGVFRLHNTDIFLEEVEPGIDVDKDIISKMNFLPKIKTIEKMDERIFYETKMGIREDLLHI